MAGSDPFSVALVPLISAASGLIGVGLGAFLTSRNQKQDRRQRFIRDQLTEFYSPMLGIRERLRVRGEVCHKVRTAAGSIWPRLMEDAQEAGRLRETRERLSPNFMRIIEDDNKQFEDELIPLFRQMADLFTAKMQFAEASTRLHFGALIEFIEIWERRLRGALPSEVIEAVEPNERNLAALYADLETNFERLQAALKE
jgi:hypothetical protein